MDNNLAYEARAFGDLGNWYEGPWVQRETADGSYEVVHQETGTVLATLPDFAAPIALWMCVARDALPQLIAEHGTKSADALRHAADFFEGHSWAAGTDDYSKGRDATITWVVNTLRNRASKAVVR